MNTTLWRRPFSDCSSFFRCIAGRQEGSKASWFQGGEGRNESVCSHLGVNQPAVVERDVQQIEHDAFWGVLEDSHPRELYVHVQACLQLVQHRHGVTHVLGDKKNKRSDSYY